MQRPCGKSALITTATKWFKMMPASHAKPFWFRIKAIAIQTISEETENFNYCSTSDCTCSMICETSPRSTIIVNDHSIPISNLKKFLNLLHIHAGFLLATKIWGGSAINGIPNSLRRIF
jgi:hypothetical protein